MTSLCCDVIKALRGRTLVTAESCTGGGIGSAITAVAGSSSVFKGGIICYCNEIKHKTLGVDLALLERIGAVSAPVAEAMASGVREILDGDVGVSVTGLAGPGGDEFGNPVGTVFIGYADGHRILSRKYTFSGDRETVRRGAIESALRLILEMNSESNQTES